MKTRAVFASVVAGFTLVAPLAASAQAQWEDKWQFSVMPYLWLPSIDGKLRYGPPALGGGSANVNVDASTILDNLAFAAMIDGQVRKGRWFAATDVIYLDLQSGDGSLPSVTLNPPGGRITVSTSPFNSSASTKLTGWLWTMGAGYSPILEPRANLDVFGGFRYLGLKATTDWSLTAAITAPGGTAFFPASGSLSQTENVWAGIVGAKGRVKLGQSEWFVNYYGDIGGWSSLFTWQGALGIGYAFKWGDILLDYRYLYYSQSGDKLIDNLSFGGVALGVNFRF